MTAEYGRRFYLKNVLVVSMFFAVLLLAGCRERTPVLLPTPMQVEARLTEIVLTENAPPPAYSQISVERIDSNLSALSGWRYSAQFIFEGVYSGTTREANASSTLDVEFNQVANARRVVARIDTETQSSVYEAVRLGQDAFLVRDGVCLANAGDDALLAAELSAADLLGGVRIASNLPRRAVVNGEQVWAYALETDALALPGVRFREDSRMLSVSGDLWFAPERNAVVRYYLNLELENVALLDSDAPVTGTLLLRYDLYDIGVLPNLSVPFGC